MKNKSIWQFAGKNWYLIAAILYLLSPFDLIPDLIPVFGGSDDVLVLLATLFIKYRQFKKGKKSEVIEGEVIEGEIEEKK